VNWTTTLSGLTPEMIATPGGWVEIARTGSGPAVLLIHGTPGSWRQCVPLAEDLAGSFDVILPSRPGYGRTQLRLGRTYDEQADCYAAVLDSLEIDRAAIVGVSGGGPSSIAFASKHPDRTSALGLVCAVAPHLLDVPRSASVAARIPAVPQLVASIVRALGRRRLTNPDRVRRELQKSLTPDEYSRADSDHAVTADLVRHALSHLEAPPGLSGMRNDLRQFEDARRAGAKPSVVKAPTFVLHGDADPVVGVAAARHHAEAIADAQIEVYEQAGHLFMLTRRSESSAALRTFLQEHAS
jgi:pimeloyl-ACP methyl ester carboxylesterase